LLLLLNIAKAIGDKLVDGKSGKSEDSKGEGEGKGLEKKGSSLIHISYYL
jgi:hypothetical protein